MCPRLKMMTNDDIAKECVTINRTFKILSNDKFRKLLDLSSGNQTTG